MDDHLTPFRPVAVGTSIAAQVLDALTDAIANGELVVGQTYSMGSLAERMGVSRTPVRDAMLELQLRGAVRVVPNQGALILGSEADRSRDVREIRVWLEVPAAGVAARRASAGDREELRTLFAKLLDAAERGDAAGFEHEDRALHRALLGLSGNGRLAALVDGLRDDLAIGEREVQQAATSLDLKGSAEEHRQVLEAIEEGDAEAAEAAMRHHLDDAGPAVEVSPSRR
jgi:DNA-binding GntR family transcriptional regulator